MGYADHDQLSGGEKDLYTVDPGNILRMYVLYKQNLVYYSTMVARAFKD
jgi:hypothetical protein